MSGGHFNDCGYYYLKVSQFADELEQEIENNFINDDWGYHHGYPDEVIECLKFYIPQMNKMAEIMKHIDYLYAGDHGPDSSLERIKEVEERYKDT